MKIKFGQIFVGVFNGLIESNITKNGNFMKDFIKKLDAKFTDEDKKIFVNEINKINNPDAEHRGITNLTT